MNKAVNLKEPKLTQTSKGLNGAGTEFWNSSAVGQCNIVPPVNQEPSVEYSLSGA